MADRVLQRHDTAANWQTHNPVLAEGELGIITDGAKGYKIGDGVTAWNDLDYLANPAQVVQELGDSESAVISQKGITDSIHNIGFVSLNNNSYITWYIEEKEINIPTANFISTNGKSYSTNTITEPISYADAEAYPSAIKLYFDTVNLAVKVYPWDDTSYMNEVSSYLYIGYVYNGNICIFGAENQTRIYQNKQSKTFDNIQNHIAFHGTLNNNVTYNPTTKIITFSNGFISIGEKSFAFTSQTIDLSNIMSESNCWKLYFSLDTGNIYALDWATANSRINDPVLGYIYNNKVRLLNLQNDYDVRISGVNTFEKIPDFCIFAVPANTVITHNIDNKTIQLTGGNFLINHNATYPIGAQTLDYSEVELANTAGVIYVSLIESTKTLHIISWGNFIANAPYEAKVVGYIYGKNLFLFGVDQSQINIINSSISGEPNPKFGAVTAIYGRDQVIYDVENKTIQFNSSNYVIANGKGYPQTTIQNIEVTDIETDLAYNIFFDISTRQFSILHWTNEQSTLPDDANKFCVGYVYKDHIRIFGLSENNIRFKRRTVYFFGDSITAGVGTSGTNCYHQFIAKDLNLKCLNYGVGSIGFCVTTSSNVCVGNGAEGQGTWQQESGNNTILQIMQAHNDFEYVSIWAGTNDYGAGTELDTFKTAVEAALDYALSVTPYVVCATPIRRRTPTQNSKGYTLSQYCDIIKTACEERGIPCFDAYNNTGLNPVNDVNNNTFYSDGLHTNSTGQKRMAIKYKEYIKLISEA